MTLEGLGPVFWIVTFWIGACVGSFLNVCIFRLPTEESIVSPVFSRCPACKHRIRWYDNIPLVSYALLGGRCRDCRGRISPQYAIIEALTGGLFVLFVVTFGFSWKTMIYLPLTLSLLVASAIDWRHKILPDVITLPGIVLGLGLSLGVPAMHSVTPFWKGGAYSAAGILVGGGFLYLAGTLAEIILKKEAMGGGDVKLLAMIGAFIGVQGVIWTIFVSSLVGSAFGLFLRMSKGEEKIPFGPFLSLAAILYLFIGPQTTHAYLNWIGLH